MKILGGCQCSCGDGLGTSETTAFYGKVLASDKGGELMFPEPNHGATTELAAFQCFLAQR